MRGINIYKLSMNYNKIISPCSNECKLDEVRNICLGCGRTTKEIIQWIVYSDEQRLEIMEKLPQRLKDYHHDNSKEISR